MIKAVLFDLGDTLIKSDVEFFEEVFQRILNSQGIPKSLGEVKKAFSAAEIEAKKMNLLSAFGTMQCDEYWNTWDALVLKHLDIIEYGKLGKVIHAQWFDFVHFTLYPEVEEVLAALKQRGLKIGIISQGYEEEIHFLLKEVNLDKLDFDVIVGVDTIKKAKPDPDVFLYAVDQLNVQLEEAIFVGDNIEMDYKGAKQGMLRDIGF